MKTKTQKSKMKKNNTKKVTRGGLNKATHKNVKKNNFAYSI